MGTSFIRHSSSGFTILELLVASLLLGMLMTILTMIFNQSSIAWRTGIAGEARLGDVRQSVANFRYEADNAYPDMNGSLMCVRSVFKDDGTIRDERLVEGFYNGGAPKEIRSSINANGALAADSFETSKGCGTGSYGNGDDNYVVNVKCAGPDREFGTYDDIWSFPDDPDEW